MTRRVVITGMGMITPFGLGVAHNWEQITAGNSGIRSIKSFDASDISSQIAGEVPLTSWENAPKGAVNIADFISPKEQRKMDKFIHFGLIAADEAIKDSGWEANTAKKEQRTGVLIGSGIGGLSQINDNALILENKGPRRISPFFIPSALINLISGQLSIKYGFRGPNHSVVTACATGTHAIGDAARIIMTDDADIMIAGGAEAAICRLGVAGFAAARALSTGYNDNPQKASRPFDKDRDGFVIGEGAGILVLEELEHAKARNAKIYGEIIGYGMSGDAYHITSPAENGEGGYQAMLAALKRAGISTSDVTYVNAHGTSTPLGDDIEVGAVKRLFGADIDKLAMSSTKSAIGHLLGAAGAVEAIYTIKAIKTGIIPPTLNLENPSEGCLGVNLVPKTAQEKNINIAISNSFGFGGTNASLVIKDI